MNNGYKLLVIDIDGTLQGKNGTISLEDREALDKVRDAGIPVSLSTGRTATATSRIVSQLSLNGYHIFFDGALVSDLDTGEEVYVQPIIKATLRQAAEFAHQNELGLEFYSVTDYFTERETWSTDIRRRLFGIEPNVVDFTDIWDEERIIKGTLTVSSPEERIKAGSFSRHFGNSLSFSVTKSPAYPEIDFINVLAPGVSKRKALEALVSHLGISLSDVMAVGDGANDISVLSSVGMAVAMGNAPDEVKSVADYVTLDVDHSGLAAAINRFLL